jgi:hypothetical protein
MGAVGLIIVLAGMVVPIVLLLATLLFDIAVVVWAAYRLWHDRWSRTLGAWIGRRTAGLVPSAGRPGVRRA